MNGSNELVWAALISLATGAFGFLIAIIKLLWNENASLQREVREALKSGAQVAEKTPDVARINLELVRENERIRRELGR